MALELNTNHALFGNLVALVAVDEDNAIKDLVTPSRVLTEDAGITKSTGTYGRHFLTGGTGTTPVNVDLSPAIDNGTTSMPNQTHFIVVNDVISGSAKGVFFGGTSPTIGVDANGFLGTSSGGGNLGTLGSTDVRGTSSSLTLTRTSQTSHDTYINKTSNSTGGRLAFNTNGHEIDKIGGYAGFGVISVEIVWVAVFDKVLDQAEREELHDSLGADNQFSMVESSPVINATLGVTSLSAFQTAITGSSALVSITTEPLKNNTGTLLASTGSIIADVYDISTGALVVRKTGLTSGVDGVVSFTDALLVTATEYRVIISISTSDGVARITTS